MAATNICCESTARAAFMLNYRTFVVSDANATTSGEAHNASPNALVNRSADVFTMEEVTALLAAGSPVALGKSKQQLEEVGRG